MQLPREVIVGNGLINRVAEITKRLNLNGSALIISGTKSYEVAGKKVYDLLEQAGMDPHALIVKSTTSKDIEVIEKQITELKPKILFGVGGGTIIDVTKINSDNKKIPFISVPTTVSHDGIASPLASIKSRDKPCSIMSQAPLAIIADIDVIALSPWRSVISGCGDVIAKFTAVKDWELAHKETSEYYGEYAASLSLMSAQLLTTNAALIQPGNVDGLRVLLEALISCGVAMSIAGSSRPCSGSEHLFSHALDMISPNHAMHGEQVGIGSIISAFIHGINWQQIRDTLKQIGAPTTAKELDLKDEDIIKALTLAPTIRPERYTILHKQQFDYETCQIIAKKTKIID
jgi:glycerol-1-phosphate dehydrogenase [NAD(P)+]